MLRILDMSWSGSLIFTTHFSTVHNDFAVVSAGVPTLVHAQMRCPYLASLSTVYGNWPFPNLVRGIVAEDEPVLLFLTLLTCTGMSESEGNMRWKNNRQRSFSSEQQMLNLHLWPCSFSPLPTMYALLLLQSLHLAEEFVNRQWCGNIICTVVRTWLYIAFVAKRASLHWIVKWCQQQAMIQCIPM